MAKDLSSKIQGIDEMKLKLLAELEKKTPEDILYPAELNEHLIDQLKVLTAENEELRKVIFSKEAEVQEQTKIVNDLQQRIRDIISGSGPAISSKSAGVISAKITELCKQNRHMVAELESTKSKKAALERKVMELEIIIKDKEHLDLCVCKDEPIEPTADELKELNSKLASVNKKLYETKNKNLELKNDILIATKILQQELGDKFTSIKDLQNELAGWKGRAQEITYLKQKVAELEEKLNIRKAKEEKDKKKEDQSEFIKDLQNKRKNEIDQFIKEHEGLKHENQELRKKLDGAKCRIRNLECDSMMIRQKLQTFVEKSNHDDILINEQRKEIKSIESYYQEMLKENTVKMNKLHAEIEEYKTQFVNTEAKVSALSMQANEKCVKIEELRAQLLRYEECSLQSVFFTPMKTATDNEIKKLTELVTTLNERLDIERHKYEQLEEENRKLREKRRRVERKMLRLEEEMSTTKMESSRRVSRVSMRKDSDTATAKKKSSTTTESSSLIPEHEGSEILSKEDLKFKLELAEEKLKILEDRLKMLEEEKAEDCNHLLEMIQTSKQLFNQALAVLQREKCMCSDIS